MSNYNPYKSALSAAAAELSSPQAQCYYVNRAQQDLQTALVLIIQFGCFAYALGAQFREWAEGVEQNAKMPITNVIPITLKALPPADSDPITNVIPITLCLPSFAPIALLPAAIDKPARLPSRWVGESVIVTPAPKATRAPRARKAPTSAPKGKGKKQPVIA